MPKIIVKKRKLEFDKGLETGGVTEDTKLKMAPMSKHIKLSSPKKKMTIYSSGVIPTKAKTESGEGTTTYRNISKERLEAKEAKRLGMSAKEYKARKRRHLRIRRK